MFGNALKPWHILVLLVVVLLLFGAKRLPDLAKSVGQSLKIFKSEVKDLTKDDDEPPATPPASPAVTNAAPPVAPYTANDLPPRDVPQAGAAEPPSQAPLGDSGAPRA